MFAAVSDRIPQPALVNPNPLPPSPIAPGAVSVLLTTVMVCEPPLSVTPPVPRFSACVPMNPKLPLTTIGLFPVSEPVATYESNAPPAKRSVPVPSARLLPIARIPLLKSTFGRLFTLPLSDNTPAPVLVSVPPATMLTVPERVAVESGYGTLIARL